MTSDNAIGATPVQEQGDELVAGKSRKLFQPPIQLRMNRVFDVAPDGRFLVAITPKASSSALTLVTNWTSDLPRK